VNSCTSTICVGCLSVGGLQSMDIVPQATNVCMPTRRSGEWSARTIIAGSARWVCVFLFLYIPVIDVVLGPACPRKHVRKVACQAYLTGFCPMGPDCPRGQYVRTSFFVMHELTTLSPKPNHPPPKAYDPPSPPSAKDLGPPPPGYARFAEMEKGGGPGMGHGGMATRRNLDEVLCFKVCGVFGSATRR